MVTPNSSLERPRWISWVIVILFGLALVFLIASYLVLEFASPPDRTGDPQTPWYYWLFFILSLFCLFAAISLQLFQPSPYLTKKELMEILDDEPQIAFDKTRSMEEPRYSF